MALPKAILTLSLLALSAHAISAKQLVWGNVAGGKFVKCHATCAANGCGTVKDQSECLNIATAMGHKFYSYRSYDRKCHTSKFCKLIDATTPWHSFQAMWKEVKIGNYKCHTKCTERLCMVTKSQAECQTFALSLGVPFYSYRDVDKLCAPAKSCNQMTATISGPKAWHAYGTDEAVANVNAYKKTTTWSMVGATPGRKCHANCSVDNCDTVRNQADCRSRALMAGNSYYSYRQFDKKCATTSTCEQATPTKLQWNSYEKMWPRVLNMPLKCHSTCAEDGCFPVASRGDCQRKAESFGHKYYSYRPPDKMCITTESCDQPKATRVDWRTFGVL
jgi:hypothetical protein